MDRKTLFLVDDNPSNLKIGKNVLSESYRVYTTSSASNMFTLLKSVTPELILLDIEMPEMNGYEAIKILKSQKETRDIPVIFLTAKIDTEDELAGLDLGAIDYITKPFKPALLLKRIEVHLLVEDQKKMLGNQQKQLEYYNKNLEKALSSYLSTDVVQEIMSDPSRLELGGTKRNMTALFTDIQGFSSISEKLDPENLVSLLNKYLTGLSDILLEQKGTIDKYVGDAILTFFGAPLTLTDHAYRACASAILMKKKEKELNESFVGLSPSPILTRIGINSGDMVVGNMGSERKMNYTVMGNEVNIASRLEAVNKMFGSWILISENTYNVTGDKFLCRRLGRVKVSGISSAVVVYELLDFAENARSEQQTNIEQFNRALALFEKRDWTGAEKLFGEVIKNFSDDHPAHFYMQRCSLYALIPPSQDWDGVLDWNSK